MRKSQSSCGVGSAALPSLAWTDSPELESGLDLFDLFFELISILFYFIFILFYFISFIVERQGGGGVWRRMGMGRGRRGK